MVYRMLADLVVIAHFAFIGFVATGGLLAWRRPALVWLHLPALAWAVGILLIGFACPLTALEKHFRRLGGEPGYAGGFIDHYIENVLYPQRFTPVLLALAAAAIVLGYVGLLTKRGGRPTMHRTPGTTRPNGIH